MADQRDPESGPSSSREVAPLPAATFHILLALAQEERHGYGIMREVDAQTDGAIRLGPGTLYGALKRMLAAGWIVESGERDDPQLGDERRRYYRISALGREVVSAEARRLAGAVRTARALRLIGPEPA